MVKVVQNILEYTVSVFPEYSKVYGYSSPEYSRLYVTVVQNPEYMVTVFPEYSQVYG